MSNHLGDTNKMVSETPRMKAAQMAAIEHGTGDVWRVGCDIERELNAANQRIKRLEEDGDEAICPIEYATRVRIWTKAKEAKL
jgi:hypothetical protein